MNLWHEEHPPPCAPERLFHRWDWSDSTDGDKVNDARVKCLHCSAMKYIPRMGAVYYGAGKA